MNEDQYGKMMLSLGRLEKGQEDITKHLKVQDKRLDAHSGKINTLEKQSAWRAGAAAVLGFVGAIAVKAFWFK